RSTSRSAHRMARRRRGTPRLSVSGYADARDCRPFSLRHAGGCPPAPRPISNGHGPQAMTGAASAALAAASRERDRNHAGVRAWLYGVAFLIICMVVVGGATRLTNSGLSITEWQPIHGVIPPMNGAEWQDEFGKYRQIPEYKLLNPDMTLAEFKGIFWWEWAHRLLGRVIGIVFLLPLVFFAATGRIERPLIPKLAGLFVLGGLQGVVGWWMVASGLIERTDVSQYRLAVHLTLACALLAAILWVARGLGSAVVPAARGLRTTAGALVVLVLGQIFLGAIVAGLNAGLVSNTWP